VAAIVGALITGFGAAALKHKWDSEADQTRWLRERGSRDREQRLDAFAGYLAARPDLNAAKSLANRSVDPAAIVSTARLAASKLLVLLSEGDQRDVVEKDLQKMVAWVTAWASPSFTARTDVPSADPILDLARKLVAEPDERTRLSKG
jgi:hypothetical protein